MNRLSKPEDGDADDGDTLDKGSNRVSDGRGRREDYESNYVLGKMDGAVENEIV